VHFLNLNSLFMPVDAKSDNHLFSILGVSCLTMFISIFRSYSVGWLLDIDGTSIGHLYEFGNIVLSCCCIVIMLSNRQVEQSPTRAITRQKAISALLLVFFATFIATGSSILSDIADDPEKWNNPRTRGIIFYIVSDALSAVFHAFVLCFLYKHRQSYAC
jgi:hypothetical protein